MSIAINYQPGDLHDFKQAVDFLEEKGLIGKSAVGVAPVASRESRPNVERWKQLTGKQRFKMSADEEASGKSPDEVAADRIAALGETVADEEETVVERPPGFGKRKEGDGALGFDTDDDESPI